MYEHLRECVTLCLEIEKKENTQAKRSRMEKPSNDDDDLDGLIKVTKDSLNEEDIDTLITKEIENYKAEESLGLGFSEPLQWWKNNQHRYPYLSKVMSDCNERVFSTAGNIFIKREQLTPENAKMMVFLYHNYEKFMQAVHVNWDNTLE